MPSHLLLIMPPPISFWFLISSLICLHNFYYHHRHHHRASSSHSQMVKIDRLCSPVNEIHPRPGMTHSVFTLGDEIMSSRSTHKHIVHKDCSNIAFIFYLPSGGPFYNSKEKKTVTPQCYFLLLPPFRPEIKLHHYTPGR